MHVLIDPIDLIDRQPGQNGDALPSSSDERTGHIAYAVTLADSDGNKTAPATMTFRCGTPAEGFYQQSSPTATRTEEFAIVGATISDQF